MTTTTESLPNQQPTDADVMPVHGIDHLEFYVGNAAQAAYYYTRAYGFTETAYEGLETGSRDRVSHVLEQGRIRLVLTGTLTGDDEIAEHHKRHGDGVISIALSVPDAAAAYEHAVSHGARGIRTPYELTDEHGTVRLASVATYGETRHVFVERAGYHGAFLPGYVARGIADHGPDGLLVGIDHVVGNVELGHMEEWVHYYERVFGMTELIHFTDEAISTEYSALMSKVVTDGSGKIKFPINEPATGKRKSQIEEYLDFYRGPGVQHIAVSTTEHRPCGDGADTRAGSSSCRSLSPTMPTCPSGSARSPRTSPTCSGWGSSSTATKRATCCRSSARRSATGRRCSSS